MEAFSYWKTVVKDATNFLDQFLALLQQTGIRYCVIGGQGVNAYAEPVVSLDLDIAVAIDDLDRLEPLLREQYRVERFPHSLNVSSIGSDLRVQIQTDPRYSDFVSRAEPRVILGVSLPVARIEDVLSGKIWAVEDPDRRASKRQKDLADIARLVESHPALRERVPDEILKRLF